MASRFATAQSTVTMLRWRPSAMLTLTAMALFAEFTAGAAARQARPAAPVEATAPG